MLFLRHSVVVDLLQHQRQQQQQQCQEEMGGYFAESKYDSFRFDSIINRQSMCKLHGLF